MKLTFLYNPCINFKNNFSKYLNDLRVDDNFLIFLFSFIQMLTLDPLFVVKGLGGLLNDITGNNHQIGILVLINQISNPMTTHSKEY